MTHSAASYDRLKDVSDVIDAHARVEGKVQSSPGARVKWSIPQAVSIPVSPIWQNGATAPGGRKIRTRWQASFLHSGAARAVDAQTIVPGEGGPYNTHFVTYGLGFNIIDVKGYKQMSHTGGLEGWSRRSR